MAAEGACGASGNAKGGRNKGTALLRFARSRRVLRTDIQQPQGTCRGRFRLAVALGRDLTPLARVRPHRHRPELGGSGGAGRGAESAERGAERGAARAACDCRAAMPPRKKRAGSTSDVALQCSEPGCTKGFREQVTLDRHQENCHPWIKAPAGWSAEAKDEYRRVSEAQEAKKLQDRRVRCYVVLQTILRLYPTRYNVGFIECGETSECFLSDADVELLGSRRASYFQVPADLYQTLVNQINILYNISGSLKDLSDKLGALTSASALEKLVVRPGKKRSHPIRLKDWSALVSGYLNKIGYHNHHVGKTSQVFLRYFVVQKSCGLASTGRAPGGAGVSPSHGRWRWHVVAWPTEGHEEGIPQMCCAEAGRLAQRMNAPRATQSIVSAIVADPPPVDVRAGHPAGPTATGAGSPAPSTSSRRTAANGAAVGGAGAGADVTYSASGTARKASTTRQLCGTDIATPMPAPTGSRAPRSRPGAASPAGSYRGQGGARRASSGRKRARNTTAGVKRRAATNSSTRVASAKAGPPPRLLSRKATQRAKRMREAGILESVPRLTPAQLGLSGISDLSASGTPFDNVLPAAHLGDLSSGVDNSSLAPSPPASTVTDVVERNDEFTMQLPLPLRAVMLPRAGTGHHNAAEIDDLSGDDGDGIPMLQDVLDDHHGGFL